MNRKCGKFKYMETAVNTNCIHEEVKMRYIREGLLPFCSETFVFPFPFYLKIKIYKTIILPVVLYGLISIAAQSEASTVFGHSNVEITGLNPARVMVACLRFSVLCCPVCR